MASLSKNNSRVSMFSGPQLVARQEAARAAAQQLAEEAAAAQKRLEADASAAGAVVLQVQESAE